jgi:hypothetical protein
MAKIQLVGLLALLCGCGAEAPAPAPAPGADWKSNLSLGGLVPNDAELVGVTIAPDGARYVLDRRLGIYEVTDDKASLVWNTSGLGEFTDLVALDEQRLAVTAVNDGFLFDLKTHTFSSYFCYLPSLPPSGSTDPGSVSAQLQSQGIAVEQRTESVAFNAQTEQLFAQPQTTRLDTGAVAGSELFVFAPGGGQPIQVRALPSEFVANGMVSLGDRLILGANRTLYEATLDGQFNAVADLGAATQVSGLARAPNGSLWILDGLAKRLTKFEGTL